VDSNLPDLSDARWRPTQGATDAHLKEAQAALTAGRAVIRNLPIAGPFSPAANPASRGFAIAKTLGPFTDGAGHLLWADILGPLPAGRVAVFFEPSTQPLLVAPLAAVPGKPNQLTISKGSLWIAARAFDGAAPDNSFCGLQVASGNLTFSVGVEFANNRVVVPAAATLTLQVKLDPPLNPATASGPGVDLGQASITLPGTFRFNAGAAGIRNISAGDFSLAVYSSKVSFKAQASAKFRADRAAIEIAGKPDSASFSASAKSDFWKPGGSAPIAGGGWVLPITQTTFDKLADAAGDGGIAVALQAGITATWPALVPDLHCPSAELICGPRFLYFFLTSGPAVIQTFSLWNSVPKPSSLVLTSPKTSAFTYYSAPGVEIILTSGSLDAFLDRPLRVDNSRMPLQRFTAMVATGESTAGGFIALLAARLPTGISVPPPIPIALENALLLVQPAFEIAMFGPMDANERVTSGTLGIIFGTARLIPTLPDPYAVAQVPAGVGRFLPNVPPGPCDPKQATYTGTQLPDTLSVAAIIAWASIPSAQLGFVILGNNSDLLHECLLVDVSSNADQLGAAAFTLTSDQIALTRMQWSAVGSRVAIATLPEISWEPMVNDPSSPPPSPAFAPNDGTAAVLSVPNTTLVPVEPIPMITAMTAAAAAGVPWMAGFTLPFGIFATANTATIKPGDPQSLTLVRPKFTGGIQGGYQVAMRASRPAPENSVVTFPGTAFVDLGTQAFPGYGASVLNFEVAQIFNGVFQNGPIAPLERYDLSGYGASVFSDWRNPAAKGSDIIQARFSVIVGRTSYEVVQAQAFCCPWAARFVRSVTIERQNNAIVLRFDTGWQPASDGLFQWPAIPATLFQLGPLRGVVNIHNIHEAGFEFVAGTTTWQPVTFDADVQLNPKLSILRNGLPAAAGQPSAIPTRGIPGYLMILPVHTDLTADQLWALLDKTGPVSAPAAAAIGISQSQLTMNLSSVDVSHVISGPNQATAAAIRGTPVLPPQGSWSLARRSASGNTAPGALDPQTPVPLVQNNADTANWHFADPSDVLNLATPSNEYGFLQSTGTQKLYFAQPRVHDANPGITPQVPPHLADVGALLGAVGAFPGLAAALQFAGAIPDFQVGDGSLTYNKEWDVPAATPPVTLLDFANTVSVALDYKFNNRFKDNPAIPVGNNVPTHVTVDIRPTGWSLTMQKLNFKLLTPFGDINDPLLAVVGTLKAGSGLPPTLTDLDVVYGGILAPVQTVFANLSELARFLPGGIGAQLDVSFSNGQLTIRDSFALPQLPLGIGFVESVALDLGATITLLPPHLSLSCGISSPQKPFHWLVSPLSGNGCVVVGFEDALPKIIVQAGLGIGLDIDVGIAQGGASIVLGFQVTVTGTKVQFMALLTGQASVDVLDGLASASITLTAGLGLTPEPFPPRLPPIDPSQVDSYKPFDDIIFAATCSVGIHISVCWLVHVDFDGNWQFTKTVNVPSVGSILPI